VTGIRLPRFALAALFLGGLVILGAAVFLGLAHRDSPRGAAGTLLASAIGGPFRLVDQNGKMVTDADLKGKWSLVYFGYTHCPDACPTALNDIAVLKSYVTAFDTPILALTGTPEEIAQAAKSYRVYYAKHPEAGGDYSMDHTSIIYVMDPQGRFTASFTHESSPEEIAERLKKLLA